MVPSPSIASHEAVLHEDDIRAAIVDEKLTFHLSSLFSQPCNLNLEDNILLVANDIVHTPLDDGALFD